MEEKKRAINWYPGHMTKTRRMMEEDIKLVDLVIEIVDARIPLSSRNPDIDKLAKNKARIVLLNKSDLADDTVTDEWITYFKDKGFYCLKLNSRLNVSSRAVNNLITAACSAKIERDRSRGIKNRSIKAMIVGIPNVGKSTFLSRVTNARPKIANYHFTTLNPNLGVVDLDGGKGFVIADIPGLIEGASEGVGLGHQFLRHIERTKVIIHIVDAASTEGRDPIADIKAINKELENYNPKLLERPQVIAANKIDVIYDDGSDPVQAIRDAFEPEGIKVYPISAVTGQGVKELLYAVRTLLDNFKDEPVLFEKEFDYDELMDNPNESFEVSINEDGVYVVNGPKIDKMLGYTNLESEKGFDFFQKFMKRSGVLDELEKLGIAEGDTVIVGDYLEFDYYKA